MSRLRINSMARAFGLEEDDAPIVVEGENTDAALVESEAEVDQAMDDIDTAQDTVDTLNNDAETVENVTEIVDNSIENGEGLDETSAAIVQETIESIYRRHGMPKRHWPRFPSTESFRSRSDRIRSTRAIKVALEGAWDTIKNAVISVWESIRDFFVDLYKKFTDFEYRLFDKFKELKKEIKDKGVKSGRDKEPQDGYELGVLAKYRGTIDYSSEDWEKREKGKPSNPSEKDPVELSSVVSNFEAFVNHHAACMKEFNNLDKVFGNIFDDSDKDTSGDEITMTEQWQKDINQKVYKACMVSSFSTNNLADSDVGKDSSFKKIKPGTKDDLEGACEKAISFMQSKPLKEMEKYSNSFIGDMINTIKKFFGSKTTEINEFDKSANSSDNTANKTTQSRVNSMMAKAYRNTMSGNIKVYKDTISNYYDIIKGMVSHQGLGKDDPKSGGSLTEAEYNALDNTEKAKYKKDGDKYVKKA